MSTKKIILFALITTLLVTGATIGFFALRDRFTSIQNSPTQDNSSTAATPAPTPVTNVTGCTNNGDCAWFTKTVETNSGQPDEKVDVKNTCANQDYAQSCGLDCQNRGNVHPYVKTDKCVCDQGTCEIQSDLNP